MGPKGEKTLTGAAWPIAPVRQEVRQLVMRPPGHMTESLASGILASFVPHVDGVVILVSGLYAG